MFDDSGSDNSQSNEAQNAPMLSFYATPALGNTWFNMMVSGKSEVKTGFPQMPYIAPEAELYFSSMMNPLTAPTSVLSGASVSQQTNAGQTLQQDTTGTPRVIQGTILNQNVG